MRWMRLMKWYKFPIVWSKVTSIVNKRTMRREGPTSSAPCHPLLLSTPYIISPPPGGGTAHFVNHCPTWSVINYMTCNGMNLISLKSTKLHGTIGECMGRINSLQTDLISITERTPVVEKLIVARVVKNFPTCYGSRGIITVFTTVHHWTLLGPSNPLHTITFYICKMRCNVVFPSTPRSSN
jgi:hypothetical protein